MKKKKVRSTGGGGENDVGKRGKEMERGERGREKHGCGKKGVKKGGKVNRGKRRENDGGERGKEMVDKR